MQEPPAPTPAFDVRISSRRDAGGGLTLIVLDAPVEAVASHVRPGQYVWLGSWFVLATAPGHAWEIVLRPTGEAAIFLASAAPGTSVPAAGPFGDGFPTARGAPLVIAATGGAIAAVRAVMMDRIEHGDARSTTLFLGVSARDRLPLTDELARWSAAGVEVVPCISSEDGRVQDVVRSRPAIPKGTIILLAGQPRMIEAMQAYAVEKGLTSFVNY